MRGPEALRTLDPVAVDADLRALPHQLVSNSHESVKNYTLFSTHKCTFTQFMGTLWLLFRPCFPDLPRIKNNTDTYTLCAYMCICSFVSFPPQACLIRCSWWGIHVVRNYANVQTGSRNTNLMVPGMQINTLHLHVIWHSWEFSLARAPVGM